MFGLKIDKYDYFHPLEVASCGTETQFHVGGNLNYITW